MSSTGCLNCSEIILGNYCHKCGQKAATHRITAKHFIAHDLVHGVWHVDKGITFTLKETFTRPGYAALDYIAGKRIKYYNVFYLMLLVVGFLILAGDITGDVQPATHNNPDVANILYVLNYAARYIKYIFLAVVPLLAFNSFTLFKKLRLNYAENLIIAGFSLLGSYVIFLLSILIGKLSITLESIIGPLMMFFPILVYYQVTRGKYRLRSFIFRMLAFYGMLLTEILLLFFLAVKIYVFTKG